MTAAQDSRAQLRDRAIDLYTPPFRYEHGYIFDANGHMVSDDCGENEGAATRVRGWGRIGYMENAAALQDEVGAIIAELLTAHWQVSRAALSAEPAGLDIEGLMELVDAYGEACDAVARTGAGGQTVAQMRDSIRVVIGSMIARAKLQEKLEIAAERQPVAVPQGWRLVPEKPTPEMLLQVETPTECLFEVAASHENVGIDADKAADIYQAMLAAAPQPAAQERKPFSDEERLRIFEKHFSHDMRQGEFFDEIFIIAEREHGITGEPK